MYIYIYIYIYIYSVRGRGARNLIDVAVGLVFVDEGRGLEGVVAQLLGVIHLRRNILGDLPKGRQGIQTPMARGQST